jgi:proline racemase
MNNKAKTKYRTFGTIPRPIRNIAKASFLILFSAMLVTMSGENTIILLTMP